MLRQSGTENHETDGPLMLTEVTLERFKAAFTPGAIGLGPFSVIIGRNGSGKSTMIEAFQWLDTTIRRDAREACDRYFGVSDLMNLRSRSKTPYFWFRLRWGAPAELPRWSYEVKVEDREGLAEIAEESLCTLGGGGRTDSMFMRTKSGVPPPVRMGSTYTGRVRSTEVA